MPTGRSISGLEIAGNSTICRSVARASWAKARHRAAPPHRLRVPARPQSGEWLIRCKIQILRQRLQERRGKHRMRFGNSGVIRVPVSSRQRPGSGPATRSKPGRSSIFFVRHFFKGSSVNSRAILRAPGVGIVACHRMVFAPPIEMVRSCLMPCWSVLRHRTARRSDNPWL